MRLTMLMIAFAALIVSGCDIDIDSRHRAHYPLSQHTDHISRDVTEEYRSHVTALIVDERIVLDTVLRLYDDDRFWLNIVVSDGANDEVVTSAHGTVRRAGKRLLLQPVGEPGEIELRVDERGLLLRPGWLGSFVHHVLGLPAWTLERTI